MRVEFKEAVAGANFAYRPKRVYDLPEKIAREFVRSGKAVVLEEVPLELPALVKPSRRRGTKRAEVQTDQAREERLL